MSRAKGSPPGGKPPFDATAGSRRRFAFHGNTPRVRFRRGARFRKTEHFYDARVGVISMHETHQNIFVRFRFCRRQRKEFDSFSTVFNVADRADGRVVIRDGAFVRFRFRRRVRCV